MTATPSPERGGILKPGVQTTGKLDAAQLFSLCRVGATHRKRREAEELHPGHDHANVAVRAIAVHPPEIAVGRILDFD
jgi:hypothetical protein